MPRQPSRPGEFASAILVQKIVASYAHFAAHIQTRPKAIGLFAMVGLGLDGGWDSRAGVFLGLRSADHGSGANSSTNFFVSSRLKKQLQLL